MTETQSEVRAFLADMVAHGAGRVPDIEDLRLENAGIKVEKGAIAVDKYMQASSSHVYAGGDCTFEGMFLTPVATLRARVVASNILNGNFPGVGYTGIPSAVFTIPILASEGISAVQDSDKYKAGNFPGPGRLIFYKEDRARVCGFKGGA